LLLPDHDDRVGHSGTIGFLLGRVTDLSNGPAGDGNSSITGTAAFGITVYGYWYPGGLNLTSVID
jgi:hypothetical protein